MSRNKGDQPRTGTGDAPRGRKPRRDELFMVNQEGRNLRKQPRGWGIAKVIPLIGRARHRKK